MNKQDAASENLGTSNRDSTTSLTKKVGRFGEGFFSLFVALLIVFIVRSSLFESFKIPSGSMIPTLAIGDYIFVNKFAYGLKVPFSDALLDAPIQIIKRDPPKRGDVVVFRFPKDESIYFIKRVIGLPGDTIELRDKALYINGKAVDRQPMPESKQKELQEGEVLSDPQYTVTSPEYYIERLDRGNGEMAEHLMMTDQNSAGSRNFGPVRVPAETFFAMGDNRDVSNDSRYWGFVPMKNVAGRAMAIWFSFWIVNFWERVVYFHPSRMGTAVK